jgi:hypothetical protein
MSKMNRRRCENQSKKSVNDRRNNVRAFDQEVMTSVLPKVITWIVVGLNEFARPLSSAEFLSLIRGCRVWEMELNDHRA